MDIYHVWFNKRPGVSDTTLCDHVAAYLEQLQQDGRIASFRVTRCKLGLRPRALPEFHVMIETRDLAQLETAFARVAERSEPIEELHATVNQSVTDFMAALYRDFPDTFRKRGQERF